MKIISFPHYTCGGLLCDIFNNTYSPIGANGGILSLQHSLGKIGDSNSVHEEFDIDQLLANLSQLPDYQYWIGTHCWLGNHVDRFDSIINVTTTTYKSKLYRWVRSYYLNYKHRADWKDLQGMDLVDKARETAKNYFEPFKPITGEHTVNIEFADIVESNNAFTKLIGEQHNNSMTRWQKINGFLYSNDLWQSEPAKRFYEAEYEITQQKFYVYE